MCHAAWLWASGSRINQVSSDAAPNTTSCSASPSCQPREWLGLHLLCIMTVPQAITGRIFAHFPSVCTGNDTYLHVTGSSQIVAVA